MPTCLTAVVVAAAMTSAGLAGPAFAEKRASAGQAASQLSLSGQVLHADLPVPGATVTAAYPLDSAQGRGGRSVVTTSDENGVFGFVNLDAGTWTIKVEMRGFVSVSREVTIPFTGTDLSVPLTMRPYAEIVGGNAANAGWPALPANATGAPKPSGASITPEETAGVLAGSLVNGAATRFAQPRAIGNNRPPGTPLYSGAFSAALGNSAWNARPYSFGGAESPAPSYANTQLGAAFGGPLRIPFVVKYGPVTQASYQHGVAHTANAQSALVPTVGERGGDLSGRAAPIRDPQTGQPFPGNVIPRDRIVPQAAALLAYYPFPNGTAASGANFLRPILTGTTTDELRVAMGHNVSARTFLSGSVAYQRSVTDATSLFDFTDKTRASSIVAGLSWNRRFSTRLNIRATYQLTSSDSTLTPFFANRINVSGEAGIAGNAQDPLNWGPPALAFPDIADLRDGNYQQTNRTSHVIGGEVLLRRGGHNITFGGDARFHFIELLTQSDPRGTLNFTGAATGDSVADFLLGIPTTSAIAFGNASARIRGGSHDAYVSDNFHLAAGITLNLGLRWEYESPYRERDGRVANLDVVHGFVAVATVTGADPTGALTGAEYPAALVRPDRRGFQPRLGLSWRPSLTSSLVVRGGYGLYRNLGVYQSIGTLLAQQPPFSRTFSVQNSVAAPLTLANPFPASLPSGTTFAVDPNYRTALLHSWQVSVQRDLPHSLTVIAVYFADRGQRLTQAFLPNTYPTGATTPCPLCPSGFSYLTSGGTSTRNAAQFTLRRRLYAGFTASVSYTLAKSTDNAATFSNTTLSPGSLAVAQDWLDLDAERGPSSFDQRHLVAAEMQYTTGVGVTGGTLADGFWGALYKDWTVTAQFNAGSGLPLTPVYFAPVAGTGVVGMRPSLTGQPIASAEPGAYANPAAFTAPTPGTWGNAGRNAIRGPATSSFDMAAARVFRLGRRKTFEWRVTATNVLNRVTFSTIDRIITSPQFGRPTSANQMRRIQVLVRFGF